MSTITTDTTYDPYEYRFFKCPYCELDTVGKHEMTCPLWTDPNAPIIYHSPRVSFNTDKIIKEGAI